MKPHLLAFLTPLAISSTLCAAQAQPASAASSPASPAIGHATVQETLQALKAQEGVNFTTTKPDGWVIAARPLSDTYWSFTPPGHFAYPAVVRRQIRQHEGNVSVETVSLCEADKPSCDRLDAEFRAYNEELRQRVEKMLKASGRP